MGAPYNFWDDLKTRRNLDPESRRETFQLPIAITKFLLLVHALAMSKADDLLRVCSCCSEIPSRVRTKEPCWGGGLKLFSTPGENNV